MGKSTISMVIFNSYVKLPEGKSTKFKPPPCCRDSLSVLPGKLVSCASDRAVICCVLAWMLSSRRLVIHGPWQMKRWLEVSVTTHSTSPIAHWIRSLPLISMNYLTNSLAEPIGIQLAYRKPSHVNSAAHPMDWFKKKTGLGKLHHEGNQRIGELYQPS